MLRQTALRVGVAMAVAEGTVTTDTTRHRQLRTSHRVAVAVLVVAAVVVGAAAQGRDGPGPVRPSFTLLLKYGHLPHSAKASRSALLNLNSGMCFFATHGTTGQVQLRNYTICLSPEVLPFGSAKKT